jgi:hypothetical protein
MAEAVGPALAIALLVVSTAEHYSAAAKVIKRYRLYSSKREELISRVKVQRFIFRRTIWSLLAYDVGLSEDDASQMLADAQHTGWREAKTRAYFDQRMAEVSDELLESIRMINNQLACLNLNIRSSSPSKLLADSDLQAAGPRDIRVDDNGDPYTINGSSGGPHASRKEKALFTISEDKLREGVENVRSLTIDFRILVEQRSPQQGRTAVAKPGSCTCGEFLRKRSTEVDAEKIIYVETQEESHAQRRGLFFIPKRLISEYALALLEVQQSAIDSVSATSGRASHLTSRCPSTPPPPYSLEPTGREATPRMIEAAVLLNLLSSGLKHKLTDADDDDELEDSHLSHKRPNFRHAGEVENIGMVDECEWVDEIGEGEAQHMEYLGDHECDNPIPSMELSDRDQMYRHPEPIMPLSERITVAKGLAAALLHFHATPKELRPSLGSTLDETYLIIRSEHPYESAPPALIRNRLLFSLGVTLLELAYQAPLQSLQKDIDIDANVPPNTDYHIANRVRFQVAYLMGPKYAEVVRKCIQCDFGHGDDLDQTRLQEGFHQDVICKLEELEERLSGLNLAI